MDVYAVMRWSSGIGDEVCTVRHKLEIVGPINQSVVVRKSAIQVQLVPPSLSCARLIVHCLQIR